MKRRILFLAMCIALACSASACKDSEKGGASSKSKSSNAGTAQSGSSSQWDEDNLPSLSDGASAPGDQNSDGGNTGNGSVTPGKTNSATTPDKGKNEVIVWVVDPGSQQLKWMLEGAKDFKAKTGITISIYPQVSSPGAISEFDDVMIPAISAGNAPDVYSASIVNPNYALEVTKLVSKAYTDQLLDVVLPSLKVGGKLYNFSTHVSLNGLLLYSKTDFKNAGLDPNKPPKTISELDSIADDLYLDDGQGGYKQVGFYPWHWYMMEYPDLLVKPFGGKWIGDNGFPSVNSAENIQAMEWLLGYVKKYGVAKVGTSLDKAVDENNTYGHSLAMMCAFGGHVGTIVNLKQEKEWGIAPFPTNDAKTTGISVAVSRGVSVIKNSKFKDQAVKFCEYFTGSEYHSKYVVKNYKSYSSYSPSKKAWNDNMSSIDPLTQSMIKDIVMKAPIPKEAGTPKYKLPSTYIRTLKESIQKILRGESEIKAELNGLQSKLAAQAKEN